MFNPTAGSPTITLFQLRSNCRTLLNSHKLPVFIQYFHTTLTKHKITSYIYKIYYRYFLYIKISNCNLIQHHLGLRLVLVVYIIKLIIVYNLNPNLNLLYTTYVGYYYVLEKIVLSSFQPTQLFERDGRCVQSLTDHSP